MRLPAICLEVVRGMVSTVLEVRLEVGKWLPVVGCGVGRTAEG